MPLPALQAISEQIVEAFGGTGVGERLQALADELRAAVECSPPELTPDILRAASLLRRVAESPESHGAMPEELNACLEALGRSERDSSVDEEILAGFLDERGDSLDELEDFALGLEAADGTEDLDGILRIVHSIKGDAGVLSLGDLSVICHELEGQLAGVPPRSAAPLVFAAVEKLRERFAQLASSGDPGEASDVEVAVDAGSVPEPDSMVDVDHELFAEFVMEAREHLESIDSSLLDLAGRETEKHEEAVNAVFRAFHTIKGLSGFLNLNTLMSLAHEAEAMLHRVRSEEIPLTQYIVDAAFQVNDGLKCLVSAVESSLSTGEPVAPPENYSLLMATLERASSGMERPRANELAEQVPSDRDRGHPKPPAPSNAVPGTIKVDASRLDLLIDTIGELVIAEAMVSQCDEMPDGGAGRLPSLLGQLDKTTRELQEMAMSLRMVPIRSTFRRMARLARDVSHKLGKPIDFITQGDDTELDKTVVDVIGDPLVHMVRNAIDHGVENSVEERHEAGKPASARIELRAFHQGGCIHVEIEDDGRGLDRDRILEKAREKGLVQEDTELMSDSEVYALVFAPGFSTTQNVTEVSGRGVGLDVVRKNIEGLRGRAEIRSTPGAGTVFSIRLPLTLAIIDGMVVRVAERRYIVPTLSIIRMFRPRSTEITTVLGRGRLLRVGDELVSLHRLDDLFNLERSSADLSEMSAIVVESGAGHFAFLVDELLGQQQIVIKPLGENLAQLAGFAGGAVMPDGTVGLILDIAGLVDIVSNSTESEVLVEQA